MENKINKGNTVFIDRYKYDKIGDLLNEVLRRIEIFSKYNGEYPENIKMNINQYYDIRKHNDSLFKQVDKDYYILNVKVVL